MKTGCCVISDKIQKYELDLRFWLTSDKIHKNEIVLKFWWISDCWQILAALTDLAPDRPDLPDRCNFPDARLCVADMPQDIKQKVFDHALTAVIDPDPDEELYAYIAPSVGHDPPGEFAW